MADFDRLRVLLSGPGLIGRKHAQLIQSSDSCALSAVLAPDNAENRAFAGHFGSSFFSSIEQVFEHEMIDAAIISSPNEFHREQAIFCIEQNIPVLIEKPLTDSLASAHYLMTLVEERNAIALVGHHRTYSPLIETAQKFLASDSFGRLVGMQATALFYKPDHYFEQGVWRTKVGGGPILINASHEIGLMRSLFGEIEHVFAISRNQIRKFDVEDTAAITFGFAGGAVGTFLLSDVAASVKSWEMTSGENPSYPHNPMENCYHFVGTNGSLDFPSMRTHSYSSDNERSWWKQPASRQLDLQRGDPLKRQLDHFIQVARGLCLPRVSVQDGYFNMRIIEAIMQSIRSGNIIRVSDVNQ